MEDDAFLSAFEACTLPRAEWTHRAHVKVAFLYLRRCPFDEALDHIRKGIKAYNASQGVDETFPSGYNETTTCAFVHLIGATMQAYGEAFPCETADEFCDTHPQIMTPKVLRLYYSPERRMLPETKTDFLEPDLAPLPKLDLEPHEVR